MKERVFVNAYRELGPRTITKLAAVGALTVAAITLLHATANEIFEVAYDTEVLVGNIHTTTKSVDDATTDLSQTLHIYNWGTAASNKTYFDVHAIKGNTATIELDIVRIKTTQSQMADRQKDVLARVTRVEEILAIIETNVASMTAIQSLMHTQNANLFTMLAEKLTRIITLLEETVTLPNLRRRMNEAVNGIAFDELTSLDFTGDACVYDPFGVGPIECAGSEILAADMQGVRFQFV